MKMSTMLPSEGASAGIRKGGITVERARLTSMPTSGSMRVKMSFKRSPVRQPGEVQQAGKFQGLALY
jgi:hypothetical protein